MQTRYPLYLVSSCLVGLCTRYDGLLKNDPVCRAQLKNVAWIPVCPEQLGGLPTPRAAANIVGGDGYDVLSGKARVRTHNGVDVTREFIKGAEQVLQIAAAQHIRKAFLMGRSPSCGVFGTIGVTAALLQANSIEVVEF
ncbi:MAG: DUF523 domain-containing protein [Desulforhopalus sp.]